MRNYEDRMILAIDRQNKLASPRKRKNNRLSYGVVPPTAAERRQFVRCVVSINKQKPVLKLK
jgi:hypothetical protein